MKGYKTRKIQFKEIISSENWKIKVYTISKIGVFNHETFYKNVLKKLPEWLTLKNGFDDSNDKIAFLIVHSGTEGIFTLINWWVGKNMLNTHIFLTNHGQTNTFKKVSGAGLSPCVWELEIINHERISWTNNILKSNSLGYTKYLNEVINIEL
ncbi:hypothetical protein [Yeosuana sp.]|uniref:hypothetical protein n=1 Tax=Yeosuana sp. TaxID=2529388 RepID=UPI004054A574